MTNPIRIFKSALQGRFIATRSYKEHKPGLFTVTGAKTDVTRDIKGFIKEHLMPLVQACDALAHPDDVIRGPLTDGPELNELNAELAKARKFLESCNE